MDRFEVATSGRTATSVSDLHSSMDRFEEAVLNADSELNGNLHSSMDRFEGTHLFRSFV